MEAFLGALAGSLIPAVALLVMAWATYIKARAAALQAEAAKESGAAAKEAGDKNSAHLVKQDKQLDAIEFQVSDECVVMKAHAAAQRVLDAAAVAARHVNAEGAKAAEALKAVAAEIKQASEQSRP